MSLASTMSLEASNPPGLHVPHGDHAPRRTRSPRATRRPKAVVAEKPRKVSFYLSADIIRRLGVAASMEESDRSRVVERILRDNLKDWVVSFRGRGQGPDAGAEDLTDRAMI